MLKSMTGYGRHEQTLHGRHIVFELKAVNHKFFEPSARITRGYLFLEDQVKSYLQERIFRGKVDVFLQIEALEEADVQVLVNHALADAYVDAMKELKERYALQEELSLSALLRLPDVFRVTKSELDEAQIFADVKEVADRAVDAFLQMREAEGSRLWTDIEVRAGHILRLVEEVERRGPDTVSDYEARLRKKIDAVLADSRYDEQRVLTEVAIFADKVAVDEETVRLRSHIHQLLEMKDATQPVGRKMDFLVQELNREANTIGSKCVNTEISRSIVELKAELEKIREQVQNIE